MSRRKIICICIAASILLMFGVALWLGINGLHWGFARQVSVEETQLRLDYVAAAQQWIGKNSHDDSHREIIDLYNAHEPLAQNYKVSYNDKWCATFVSAAAIVCDLTQIIPTECGCERQIELFRQLGRWEEDDAYVPLPGDIIYYSSEDSGIGDCTAWSDHVGIVVGTWGAYIKVLEGNVGGVATYRYMAINAKTIRGYGLPDYASAANKTPMD